MSLSLRRARQALTLFLILTANAVWGHALNPSLSTFSFPDGGERWRIVFNQINLEALIAEIGSAHDETSESINASIYDRFRAMDPGALRQEWNAFEARFKEGLVVTFDGVRSPVEIENLIIPPIGDLAIPRNSVLSVGGPLPAGAEAMEASWSARFGDWVLRSEFNEDGQGYAALLRGGDASGPIEIGGMVASDPWGLFLDYIVVGFEHIVPLGLDHILFVIGLFLLSTQLRPLLIQVTSFTAAHTVTLALGALGLVNIPGSIVEPIIALSIVYVAVENVISERLQRWRPIIVVIFGLLHGLGFAGVLMEFGLPEDQFILSLLAFNIGVEIGQLAVIAACFLAVGIWFGSKPWYRPMITIPASLAIAGYATAWVLERTEAMAFSLPITIGLTVVIGAAALSFRGWGDQSRQHGISIGIAVLLTVAFWAVETLVL